MEEGSSQPTISGKARRCLISFRQCLGKVAALDPQRQSFLENQFARFSTWTSNIGVFASGHASIDHRLRLAPSIQRLVIGLLEVIHGRMEQCLDVLKIINNPVLSDPDEQAFTTYTSAVESMAREIALLHDLTRTIRREIRKADDIEDAMPSILTNENGDDIEEFLMNHFAANLQSQFPRLSDIIRLRLAKSMVLRRKRIMYKKLCCSKNPISMTQNSTQPALWPPSSTQTQRTAIKSQLGSTKPRPSGSQARLRIATPLTAERVQTPATLPFESQLKNISLECHEDLTFPPPPSHSPAATEVMCPFCSVLLPIEETTEDEKWRDHVKTDLDPYICLTENCDRPDEIYRHRNDWLKHTRKHVLRWVCATRVHNETLFNTREDYVSHMKLHHGNTVNDRRIDALADISLQLTGPLFESCPFCGIEEQYAKGSLQEHIVGHLQTLALQSLPPMDNGNEGTNDIAKKERMDYEMSTGKQVNPQAHGQGMPAFLSPASVIVPEARLAIKYYCHAGKSIAAGPELVSSEKAASQNGLIYVAQQPDDVDYTIDIPLEEPLPHSKLTNIKCQIVYDPGSDDCILINRTGALLALFSLQQPGNFQVLTFNGLFAIQPGAWGIKLHPADDSIKNGCLVEFWLRERRHTVAIAQPNDKLQNQEVEDSERSIKRQKLIVNPTMDVVRHASTSKTDWKLDAINSGLAADSGFFDLQDGDFATIHAPASLTELQTEYSPVRYKIKRINTISDGPTSKILCCEHSLIPGYLALKVLQYKNKPPLDLVSLSKLWQHEKHILNRLNHRNIVSLKAFDGRMLALFLEFLPPSLAQGRDSPFIPSDIFKILYSISSALTYLEVNGIVHNDIKPSNIAYSRGRGAVIFDFEKASLSNEAKLCGTPWYLPPEIVHDSRRHSAGDIWAFGIIMLYILKKIQYPETMAKSWRIDELRRRTSKAAKQMNAWHKFIGKAREELDQENPIENVTFRMLDEDEHSRITAAEVKNKVERMQ